MKHRKVRILLVSNMYPSRRDPSYGIFVKNTEELLKESGYCVLKSCVKKTESVYLKKISYLSCYLKAVLYGCLFPVDIVYLHYISHTSWPARIIKKVKKNALIVGNAHGEDLVQDGAKYACNRQKTIQALTIIDDMLVPSTYFAKILKEQYTFDEKNIYVFPSGGVNERFFYPQDKATCREQFELRKDVFYVGYVSRIVQDKGWDTFLEAANLLVKKEQEIGELFGFIIVGDGEQLPLMKQRIEKLRLEERVNWFPMMSQKELGKLLNTLDVFCFPTRRASESLGLIGLEALRCGILSVVSDIESGPKTYVQDGVNAFLFSANSPYDLTKKVMSACVLGEEERAKIRRQAIMTGIEYNSCYARRRLQTIIKDIMGSYENGRKSQ